MKKKEIRFTKIMEELNINGRVCVTDLARKCNVSLVTIRKDLTELEKKGFVNREQGYAVLANSNDIRRRIAINYSEKCSIAKVAASLVEDGETIMIETGSCCILLAEELAKTKKDITIITNSVFMTEYIGQYPTVNLVLLGGDYQADSQALVGPIAKHSAKHFFVDKFFVGTDGYHFGVGFTGDNHMRVDTLKGMAENAKNILIITESRKFGYQGLVPMFPLEQVKCVITDAGLSKEIKDFLMEAKIEVLIGEER